VVDSGVEMMEELGDTVEKLHSMYDLERFITEQERLLKRVPELEEEVRRLKPREDQVAVCFSSSCLLSPCLSLPLSLSLYIFIIFPPISSQLNPLFRQSASESGPRADGVEFRLLYVGDPEENKGLRV